MKTKYLFLIPIAALIMLVACDDEFQLPASEPLINLPSESFSGLPGGSINISATITDPVGLQSVSISYAEWNLTAEQTIADGQTELAYTTDVAVPANAEQGSSHELNISAVNVNGVTTSAIVTILLDGDVTAPTMVLNTPAGVAFLGEGSDLEIDISVEDDMAIKSFTIVGAQLSERVEVGANRYTYNRSLNIQAEGVYKFDVEVEDMAGNMSTETFSFAAFEPFENMYLADVDTDADLLSDVMGVPLLAQGFTQADSVGKVFQARYYNATANSEVRFTSSDETFSNLTLGADGQGNLLIDNSTTVSPLVLAAVGYYQITLDTRNLTYTVETYTPTDSTFDLIIMMGTGVTVNGSSTCERNDNGNEACWWFGSGKQLTPDPNNPYRFTGTVELFDHDPVGDGNNGFILGANLSGWSPFWRFDDGNNPNVAVPNGGASYVFDESKYGTYSAVFDTHLNQFIMVKN